RGGDRNGGKLAVERWTATSEPRPEPAATARRIAMSGIPASTDAAAGGYPQRGGDGGRIPAIYLSHGAPPLADDTLWTGQLADWSAALFRPASVLMVSAHWEAAPL